MIPPLKDFSKNPARKNQYIVQNLNDNSKPISYLKYSDIDSRLPRIVPNGKMVDSQTLGSDTESQAKTSKKDAKAIRTKQDNRKYNYALRETAAKILPDQRVRLCGCCRVDATKNVGVRHNGIKGKNGKAKITNVISCKSIWTCIVCGSRMLAERGEEVSKGVAAWVDAGGEALMLTTTHSHTRKDEPKATLNLISKARTFFWGHRNVKEVLDQVGYVGHIKALETTYGSDNGWHPHNHDVLFVSQSIEDLKFHEVAVTFEDDGFIRYVTPFREKQLIKKKLDGDIQFVSLEVFLKHFWIKACAHVGLGLPSVERGLTLQGASKLKNYLTKLTDVSELGQELTNTSAKSGKVGRRNQWQILNDAKEGCAHSSKLFETYARAFKGERQLFWSSGLKKLLDVAEVDDSKLLEEEESDTTVDIAEITPDVWQLIKRYKAQAHILTAVENDFNNGCTDEYNSVLQRLIAHNQRRIDREQIEYEQYLSSLIPDKFLNSA